MNDLETELNKLLDQFEKSKYFELMWDIEDMLMELEDFNSLSDHSKVYLKDIVEFSENA